MIFHRSILFCERLAVTLEQKERDYNFGRGNVFVAAIHDGSISGFSFSDSRSLKRCNVFMDPKDDRPVIVYGLEKAFDPKTGLGGENTDRVVFTTDDVEIMANFILRYFTDSVS